MLRDATKNEPSCPAPTAPIAPPAQIGLKYQKDPLAITHVDSPPRTPAPLHLRRHVHDDRSEEDTSELQSPCNLVCRLLLEKKQKKAHNSIRCSYQSLRTRGARLDCPC